MALQLEDLLQYTAFNKLIQGSAADQTKQAMVDLYDEGHITLNTNT